LGRRHGTDFVLRLGLPVIADVAHAQENLELHVRRMTWRCDANRHGCPMTRGSSPLRTLSHKFITVFSLARYPGYFLISVGHR
jgi:hypothetical protein